MQTVDIYYFATLGRPGRTREESGRLQEGVLGAGCEKIFVDC